jgi:4-oxalomesaconate tautomerase
MNQTAIPCILMRGGTSKGPFVPRARLAGRSGAPRCGAAAMGSPDARQIDGVGGAGRSDLAELREPARSR